MSITLKDTIQSNVEKYLNDMYTAIPAQVLSYDATLQEVEVQPAINEIYMDGQKAVRGAKSKVPVIFPSAGGGILSFPIQAGDTVLLIYSMRNIDDWLAGDGNTVDPSTLRKFSENDCVALVGLTPSAKLLNPNPDDVELKFNDNRITLKANGDVEVVTASKLSVSNDSEELISLMSELIQAVSDITVNTIYGISPVNNKATLLSLKQRLDTFKV